MLGKPHALYYAVFQINSNVLLYNIPLHKETQHIKMIPIHSFNFQKNTYTEHFFFFLHDYKMINYENVFILYSGKYGISLCALPLKIFKTCDWTVGIIQINHKGRNVLILKTCTLTVNIMVSPTVCGSSHSKLTLQFPGRRYFPVTYCSSVCFASGASAGWVMAARVTSPATLTDTTSMPPVIKNITQWGSSIT